MRTLGIELEFTHSDFDRRRMSQFLKDVSEAQGMSTYSDFADQKGVISGYDFHLTYDASVTSPQPSCRGGYELISRPFCVEDSDFRRGLKNILMNLYKSGAYTNETCGLHVHVFAGDFQPYQIQNVALFYILWQDVVHAVLPSTRLGEHRSGKISKSLIKTVRGIAGESLRGTVDLLCTYLRTRYLLVNFKCFFANGTYEVRAGQGMLHPRRVWNWILLTDATAKYARRTRALIAADKAYAEGVDNVRELVRTVGAPELEKYYVSEYHNWRES